MRHVRNLFLAAGILVSAMFGSVPTAAGQIRLADEWDTLPGNPTFDNVLQAAISWTPPGETDPWLVVGGTFQNLDSTAYGYIAAWDGTQWLDLNKGFNKEVRCLAVIEGRLVAGGAFDLTSSSASGNPGEELYYVAWWDHENSEWKPFLDSHVMISSPVGVNDAVQAIAWFDGSMYVGGYFTKAPGPNGSTVNYVARWTPDAMDPDWTGGTWGDLDSGVNGSVRGLTSFDGSLWVGGEFTFVGSGPSSIAKLARWSGSAWSGNGATTAFNDIVEGFAVVSGELHAAGYFTQPGLHFAKFVSGDWNAVGAQTSGIAMAIVPSGGLGQPSIYAAGLVFDGISNGAIEFDGTDWDSVVSGTTDEACNDVTSYKRDTVFVGSLSTAGAVSVSYGAILRRCSNDFNQDGVTDFFDYADFIGAFSGNDPSADINGDTVLDFFDYADFVQVFANAHCSD